MNNSVNHRTIVMKSINKLMQGEIVQIDGINYRIFNVNGVGQFQQLLYKVNLPDLLGSGHYKYYPEVTEEWREVYMRIMDFINLCTGNYDTIKFEEWSSDQEL